jgi:TolA-binding protein
MMRGEYEPAIQKLQVYLREKPNGKLASRASFLIAKAYLGLGKTGESRQQFEQTIRKYADSEEAHKSKYKLAMLSMLGGDHDDARKRFAALTGKPSGTLVPEAAAMLRYLDQQNSAKPTGDE